MYLTEAEINIALNKGFTVIMSPHTGVKLERGRNHIWMTHDGYQSADLVRASGGIDVYANHCKFDDVRDAMSRQWAGDFS